MNTDGPIARDFADDTDDDTLEAGRNGSPASDGSDASTAGIEDRSPRERFVDGLAWIRSSYLLSFSVTALLALVGLALASVHWIGIVVGGTLVALPARTFPLGVASGLVFGVAVVFVFLLVLATGGLGGAAVAMGQPFWAAVGIGIACSLLGSLARGLV